MEWKYIKQMINESELIFIIVAILIGAASALYEDQIGKFDW